MSRSLQVVVLLASLLLILFAIDRLYPSIALGATIQQDTLNIDEQNHAQLAFCFGGYAYMLVAAREDNNEKLTTLLEAILKNIRKSMAILEYSIAEAGKTDGVWGDMFEVAKTAQAKHGYRYVLKNGAIVFLPDIKKCGSILELTDPQS